MSNFEAIQALLVPLEVDEHENKRPCARPSYTSDLADIWRLGSPSIYTITLQNSYQLIHYSSLQAYSKFNQNPPLVGALPHIHHL
jgi:hypothetical protein